LAGTYECIVPPRPHLGSPRDGTASSAARPPGGNAQNAARGAAALAAQRRPDRKERRVVQVGPGPVHEGAAAAAPATDKQAALARNAAARHSPMAISESVYPGKSSPFQRANLFLQFSLTTGNASSRDVGHSSSSLRNLPLAFC